MNSKIDENCIKNTMVTTTVNPVTAISTATLSSARKVTFKDLGNGKTEVAVTEYDWTDGQMMEMSKMGMEQWLDKMAVCFGKA